MAMTATETRAAWQRSRRELLLDEEESKAAAETAAAAKVREEVEKEKTARLRFAKGHEDKCFMNTQLNSDCNFTLFLFSFSSLSLVHQAQLLSIFLLLFLASELRRSRRRRRQHRRVRRLHDRVGYRHELRHAHGVGAGRGRV